MPKPTPQSGIVAIHALRLLGPIGDGFVFPHVIAVYQLLASVRLIVG